MAMGERTAFGGSGARLTPRRARMVTEYLRRQLRLSHQVRLERISRWQVTGEDGRPGEPLVGVAHEKDGPCIFHTRALTVEDLVHEMLHVRHPELSEDEVNARTAVMLRRMARCADFRTTLRDNGPSD
ncbi:MAG: hypothetical protein AMXMBFR61_15080 [Fimbriimonadales bacterium]